MYRVASMASMRYPTPVQRTLDPRTQTLELHGHKTGLPIKNVLRVNNQRLL
jgi:hypothetical protein